jgi:SHS2 domain-containing protein
MGYEIIEHTADLGLRVWAPDLPGLFEEAARGLIAIMGRGSDEADRTEHGVVAAPDPEALLVDWLSEVLFLFEARGLVPQRVEVHITEDPWRLRAELAGSDPERFVQHGPAVKAVTYHAIEVNVTPTGAEARVYLDV